MTATSSARRSGPGLWLLALFVSALVHAMLWWVIAWGVRPDEVPYLPQPEATLTVTAHAGRTDRAEPADPIAENIREGAPQPRRTALARPPRSRAESATLDPQTASAGQAEPDRIAPAEPAAVRVGAAAPSGSSVKSVVAGAPAASAAATEPERLVARTPAREALHGAGASAVEKGGRLEGVELDPEGALSPLPGPTIAVRSTVFSGEGRKVAAASATFDAIAASVTATEAMATALSDAGRAPTTKAHPLRLPTDSAVAVRPKLAEEAARELAAFSGALRLDSLAASAEVAPLAQAPRSDPARAAMQAPTTGDTVGSIASPEQQTVTAAAGRSRIAPVTRAEPTRTAVSGSASAMLTRAESILPPADPAVARKPPHAHRVASRTEVLASLSALAATSVMERAAATQAALAWSGATDTRLDPQSLAAIQSFMAPQQATGGASVRDGLDATLSSLGCSRLAAAFSPEGGSIEVRGHARDPETASDAITRVQAAVGSSISVAGDILILPEPQCAVLEELSALGLPQSTDQKNDPLVVGRIAQERYLDLESGEPVVFGLEAPDYDAYIYIDFFDAEGFVTHVTPNELAPLRMAPAGQRFSVGDGGDGSDLRLTVTPPFGKEIIVVIATTHRLFSEHRPLREAAGAYLADLRDRVAALEASLPGFHGEWVYMLLETFPRGRRGMP